MPRWISRRGRNGIAGRGILAGVLAVAAGLGFWGYGHFAKTAKPAPQAVSQHAAPATAKPAAYAARPPQPALTDAPIPGPRYVHRGGSVLRDKANVSGHSLKKEAKGAKVTLEAVEGDGWAKVTDGNIHGWMRASVLGVNPPE